MDKLNLYGVTKDKLTNKILTNGYSRFRSDQIINWLYKHNVKSINDMKNIPDNIKDYLNSIYTISKSENVSKQESVDGTQKFLWKTAKEFKIESALIPDKERATLCLSTQSGCKRGCKFCMTANMGFLENISSGDILNQYSKINEAIKITNIVFMGMGEPFDNFENVMDSIEVLTKDWGYGLSSRRITVSTVGIVDKLESYVKGCECHLAISLHNAIPEERAQIMPVENVYPIKDVVCELKRLKPLFKKGRKLTFEYTLLDGVNDSKRHVKEISRLINGLRASVNLIHYNSGSSNNFKHSSNENAVTFQNALKDLGIPTNIRRSRGDDISAACGQLAGQS